MTPTTAPEPTDPIERQNHGDSATEVTDTAALLALAKAATPGSWGYVEAPMFNGVLAARRDVATTGPRSDPRSKADGLFIAAANPETVTRLCEEVERLRGLVEGVRGLVDDVPLIVSGIRRDIERTPSERGGTVKHTPGTTGIGASGCPGDNLTRWFDDLTALLATLDKEEDRA